MIRLLAATALMVVVTVACNPPSIAGDPLKPVSTGEAFGGVNCSAVRPQSEPDLMAWDPGSRSNLNGLRRQGVVAVRYEARGCNVELELLSHCIGSSAKYEFAPYSANEHKVAHNANELYAQLPVGAARFAASVKGTKALRTDYMLAGQYSLPAGTTFSASDLRGQGCERATHVVSAVYVGAFAMGAGESRAMEGSASLLNAGAGAKSTADVEVLGDEGNADACRASQADGKENPLCAVPLRIGLLELASRKSKDVPAPSADHSSARVTLRDKKLVTREKIQFELRSATIKPQSAALLHDVAEVIRQNPQIKRVAIEMHASSEDYGKLNTQISDDRANAVRDWLVTKEGIPSALLTAKGWGADRPLATNATPEGQEQNRRTEFLVTE